MTFQDLILKLQHFWASQGCLIQQPLDLEVGAGTSHPETLLRVLGSRPWNALRPPSRRPDETLRPESERCQASPAQVILSLARRSAAVVSRQPRSGRDQSRQPDIRSKKTTGSRRPRRVGHRLAGDARGTEITQFNYFQQVGGIDCRRFCELPTASNASRCSQKVDNVSTWSGAGQEVWRVRLRDEVEHRNMPSTGHRIDRSALRASRHMFDET